jgi:uncharacterized membrane protein
MVEMIAFIVVLVWMSVMAVEISDHRKQLREYEKRIARLEATEKSAEEIATTVASETPPPKETPPVAALPVPTRRGYVAATEPMSPVVKAVPATDVLLTEPTGTTEVAKTALEEKKPVHGQSLAAFIKDGNLWAAGGILLLLAGFATLITYLASKGFFTVEMGIAAAALTGTLMLALGWRFRKRRPVYFLLLQGGGIGILYFSVFAAHKLTAWFSPTVSLILMSLLIVPAIVLALFQGSQALALLGFIGGYAAPLLLASGMENHVFPFAYYGLLDIGVLGIGLFRRWKGPKLMGFVCTFALAVYWTLTHYQPGLFWQTEPFLLGYILIFTILGVFHSGRILRRNGDDSGEENIGGLDAVLLLGTPILGILLQWKIFDSVQHGHALVCVAFSAFYILVVLVFKKRLSAGSGVVFHVCLGFAALLANLAVPLELAPGVTGAVWAVEGLVIFFLGRRLDHRGIMIAGLIIHVATAIAFCIESTTFFNDTLAGSFRSVRFIGAMLVSLSALGIVFLTERPPLSAKIGLWERVFSRIMGIWAFVWWFGGWANEILRISIDPLQSLAAIFLLCSVSAFVTFEVSKLLRVPAYRIGMIPAPIAGFLLFLAVLLGNLFSAGFSYFFQGAMRWAWVIFFTVQISLLFISRRNIPEKIHGLWLLIVLLTGVGVLSFSGRIVTSSRNMAPAWTSLAGMVPVFVAMLVTGFLARRGFPRFFMKGNLSQPHGPGEEDNAGPAAPLSVSSGQGFCRGIVLFIFPLILSCVMGLWFMVTLFLSGDPAPLPFYIPIINPLDLEEAFCIATFLLWQSSLSKHEKLPRLKPPAIFAIIDTMSFIFAIAVTARSVHFYGSIPYDRIFSSSLFHLCLFILSAVYGIGHIIAGNRLSLRGVWLVGASITLTDVAKFLIFDMSGADAIIRIVSFFIAGLVLLFIGWVAPLPPATKKIAPVGTGQANGS